MIQTQNGAAVHDGGCGYPPLQYKSQSLKKKEKKFKEDAAA
jgi:hypothetical protein